MVRHAAARPEAADAWRLLARTRSNALRPKAERGLREAAGSWSRCPVRGVPRLQPTAARPRAPEILGRPLSVHTLSAGTGRPLSHHKLRPWPAVGRCSAYRGVRCEPWVSRPSAPRAARRRGRGGAPRAAARRRCGPRRGGRHCPWGRARPLRRPASCSSRSRHVGNLGRRARARRARHVVAAAAARPARPRGAVVARGAAAGIARGAALGRCAARSRARLVLVALTTSGVAPGRAARGASSRPRRCASRSRAAPLRPAARLAASPVGRSSAVAPPGLVLVAFALRWQPRASRPGAARAPRRCGRVVAAAAARRARLPRPRGAALPLRRRPPLPRTPPPTRRGRAPPRPGVWHRPIGLVRRV